MRELAGYDYDKYQTVLRWPVREAFEAMVNLLRKQALDAYRNEYIVWALLAPHAKKQPKPPELPKILKG